MFSPDPPPFRGTNPYPTSEAHAEPIGYGSQLTPQHGSITLQLKGYTFMSLQPPTVLIDGRPVLVLWGTTNVPVPAGPHRVEIGYYHGTSKRYELAHLDVTVEPGQQVPLHYAAPYAQRLGAIGHQPQSHPGLWLLWTLLAIPILVVLGAIGLVAALIFAVA